MGVLPAQTAERRAGLFVYRLQPQRQTGILPVNCGHVSAGKNRLGHGIPDGRRPAITSARDNTPGMPASVCLPNRRGDRRPFPPGTFRAAQHRRNWGRRIKHDQAG